jgi:hypothetical protein
VSRTPTTAAPAPPPRAPAGAAAASRWRAPAWLRPPERPWEIALATVALLALSAVLRTQAMSAPLWADEGIAQGISSMSPGGILDALAKDGSPPLYYLLLAGWTSVLGDSEAALHGMSLTFALFCVPAALWAGWAVFDRPTGLVAATLAAVNPYLTGYAQEARMYTLLALLGLVVAAAFAKAFVQRDRRWLALFAPALALTAYTHNWGLFLGAAGAAVVLVLARRAADDRDRRALLRDGAIGFGGAALLYLPWLPTLVAQALSTGAPWASRPGPGAPTQVARTLLGGDAAAIVLVIAAGAGIVALRRARGTSFRSALALVALAAGTLVVGWLASQLSPAWTGRYFGAVLGAVLLAAAAGLAALRGRGAVVLAIVAAFWIPAVSPTPLRNKSNADVLAAELGPRLRPGDLVISIQPEQVPLLRYYLPAGLRYADPRGPVDDPRVMDWRDGLEDLRAARPAPTAAALLRDVPPGGRVLVVAPVTEFRSDWRADWTELVRRRGAQWGGLLEADPRLRQVAAAPLLYRAALTVGLRAVLLERRA